MRNFESLFYKINTFLQKNLLSWIADRANIICKYTTYIFFSFGCGFCGFFSMLFVKAPASCGKKKLNNFCWIVLSFVWAQKVCLRFLKILFQTGDVNIFVLRGVFFSGYVLLKSSFPDEKTAVKSETRFSGEAIEN